MMQLAIANELNVISHRDTASSQLEAKIILGCFVPLNHA